MRSASSTARSSEASSLPAEAPTRCRSTTLVCSTRTRVVVPSRSMVGRKLAGRALDEVGAMSAVLKPTSPRSSSACTTTPYRAPRCSWPRPPRGVANRKISPRTKSVDRARGKLSHLPSNRAHLADVVRVGRKTCRLVPQRAAQTTASRRLTHRHSHCLGLVLRCGAQQRQRRGGVLVETNVYRSSHARTVARYVLRYPRLPRGPRPGRLSS